MVFAHFQLKRDLYLGVWGGEEIFSGGDIGAALAPPVYMLRKGLPVVPDPCKFELYQLHQILSSYSSVDYILIIKWIILNSACTCVRKTRNWKQGVRGGEGGGGAADLLIRETFRQNSGKVEYQLDRN